MSRLIADGVVHTQRPDPQNDDFDQDPTPQDDASPDIEAALGRGRRRRRWPWLLIGAGLGVAGTLGAVEFLDTHNGDQQSRRTETVQLSTAPVVSADLIDSVEYDGELTRGDVRSILAGADGTVTSVLQLGQPVERGTTVASVNAEPVVAMYGSEPFWRSLESGDVGPDVAQLEANLAALGFTAAGDMTVDDSYTSMTAEAVEQWEASLDIAATGEVPLGRVVAIDGPSFVSATVDVGSEARAGAQLLVVEAEVDAVDLLIDGSALADDVVIADPIGFGTTVSHGSTLAMVDGLAVQAVADLTDVTAPILAAISEADVERLENLLTFFGFDNSGSLVIDDIADLTTVAAIVAWQEAVGLQPTGSADAAHYVVAPDGYDVTAVHISSGDVLNGGVLAVTLGRSTLSVSVEVVVDESDVFEVGTAVEVELADETVLAARVVDVADVANETVSTDETPTIDIEVAFDDAIDDVLLGPVTVRIETARIDDAVLIPTRALVSLQEGGYAVEVRRPEGDVLVGVELGAFDDGLVQVLNGAVEPGDNVVVPS